MTQRGQTINLTKGAGPPEPQYPLFSLCNRPRAIKFGRTAI